MSIWIKNRREERSRRYKQEQTAVIKRADADRIEWIRLVTERDQQIDQLLNEVALLTAALDRTKQLLQKSEEMRINA